MLLTEEEAKEKWCPMARCGNEAGCNASTPICGGSECMMWRWHKPPMEIVKVRDHSHIKRLDGMVREYQGKLYFYDCDSCDEIGPYVRLYRENKTTPEQGFCGLAGPIE